MVIFFKGGSRKYGERMISDICERDTVIREVYGFGYNGG